MTARSVSAITAVGLSVSCDVNFQGGGLTDDAMRIFTLPPRLPWHQRTPRSVFSDVGVTQPFNRFDLKLAVLHFESHQVSLARRSRDEGDRSAADRHARTFASLQEKMLLPGKVGQIFLDGHDCPRHGRLRLRGGATIVSISPLYPVNVCFLARSQPVGFTSARRNLNRVI